MGLFQPFLRWSATQLSTSQRPRRGSSGCSPKANMSHAILAKLPWCCDRRSGSRSCQNFYVVRRFVLSSQPMPAPSPSPPMSILSARVRLPLLWPDIWLCSGLRYLYRRRLSWTMAGHFDACYTWCYNGVCGHAWWCCVQNGASFGFARPYMTFGDGLWRSFDSATVSHVCTACTQHAAQESVTSVRGVRQMHNLSIVMPRSGPTST